MKKLLSQGTVFISTLGRAKLKKSMYFFGNLTKQIYFFDLKIKAFFFRIQFDTAFLDVLTCHVLILKSINTPIARAVLDLGAVREGPYVNGKPRATGRATKFQTK